MEIIIIRDKDVSSSGEPKKISIEIDDHADIYELRKAFGRLALTLGYAPKNVSEVIFNDEDLE